MFKFQPVLELLRTKGETDFKDAFGEDYGTDKGISLDSFKALLKSKLCLEVKDYDTQHLFCQIDRYSKDTITSTELSSYLSEYEKKRVLPPEGPFKRAPTMFPGVRCQDSVIEWILYPEEPDIPDEMAGNYVSISRSGIISIWTKDMKRRFETTIKTSDDGAPGQYTTWATSLACLPREKLLAVSTTAGDIRFFRSSVYKFEHRFSITCLSHIILRINCHASEKLICGDFSGRVYLIQMDKGFFARNRMRASHLPSENVLFEHLKAGRVTGLSYSETGKLHFSPVQWVEYVPTLNAVISCSVNTERAMMVHFLEDNESLSFRSFGGINCFTFCKRLNCIITGGCDHEIKIWNPLVNKSYNELLSGHSSPVNHVLVMENRLFLISSDHEKTLRVWDLLRPRCLQIIKFQEQEFPGKQSFASFFLDSTTGSLILTTYRIGKVDLRKIPYRDKTHPCSEFIILAAFSGVYNCLVTVGNSGNIAVWDADTSSLIYEHEKSHEVMDSGGVPRNRMVMTAGLDPSQRRLVTADRIGTIKVWNFHLGLCLQTFMINCNILSLSFVEYHIYAASSSGVVIDMYDDGSEYIEPLTWEKRHRSITSLDCYRYYLLASASIDGEIIIWLRRSTDAKVHLKDLKEEEEKDIEVDKNYLSKAKIEERRKCSISQILFLQRREMDFFVGNLVSCGINGRISFWNIVCTQKMNDGKLLSKFRAVFRECDGVLCLATDIQNHYLISGDTMGYVRVYELDNYYAEYGSAPPRSHDASPQQMAKFPFLRLQTLINKRHQEHSKFPEDGGSELGLVPFLLNCFRAHLGAVLKVSYVNEKDILITAGRESSVRLWTLFGAYVGRLGPTDEPWGFAVEKSTNSKPPDIEAVASSLTLFIMNNGRTPLWARAFEALRKCRLGHQPEDYTQKPFNWKVKKPRSLEDLSSRGGTLEEDLAQRLPYIRGTRTCKQKFIEDLVKDI